MNAVASIYKYLHSPDQHNTCSNINKQSKHINTLSVKYRLHLERLS